MGIGERFSKRISGGVSRLVKPGSGGWGRIAV